MKTSLNECFPDPLTPAWPLTANPVTCEARQIYALTAIACCVPGAHVLVLHEQETANLMRSCMTRGMRYLDFTIDASTTAAEMAYFLFEAERQSSSSSAAGLVDSEREATRVNTKPKEGVGMTPRGGSSGPAVMIPPPPPGPSPPSTPSTTGGILQPPRVKETSTNSWLPVPLAPPPPSPSAAAARRPVPASASASRPSFAIQNRVVACIRGAELASPDVLSVLMDAMSVAQVRCPKKLHAAEDHTAAPPSSVSPPPPQQQSDLEEYAKGDISARERGAIKDKPRPRKLSGHTFSGGMWSNHRSGSGSAANSAVSSGVAGGGGAGAGAGTAGGESSNHNNNNNNAGANWDVRGGGGGVPLASSAGLPSQRFSCYDDQNPLSSGRCAPAFVTHHIPSVHIVLFCQERYYMNVLSERFRSTFAFSTRVSLLTMDRAPVLRSNNIRTSSVINKENLIKVIAHPDSLDSVGVSVVVSSYLRHLLLVLRGSLLPGNSSGAFLARQSARFLRLLQAAAVLFEPPPEALLPIRMLPPDDSSFSPRTDLLITSANQRRGGGRGRATGAPSSSGGETGHVDPARTAGAAAVDQKTTLTTTTTTAPIYPSPVSNAEPPNFSHVIVSPADIMCLLFPLVAHHFTLSPEDLKFVGSPFIASHKSPSSSHQHNRQESSSSMGGSGGVTASRIRAAMLSHHTQQLLRPNGSSMVDEVERAATMYTAEHSFVSELGGGAPFVSKAAGSQSMSPSHIPGQPVSEEGGSARKPRSKLTADTVTYAELKRFLRYVVINYSSPAPG